MVFHMFCYLFQSLLGQLLIVVLVPCPSLHIHRAFRFPITHLALKCCATLRYKGKDQLQVNHREHEVRGKKHVPARGRSFDGFEISHTTILQYFSPQRKLNPKKTKRQWLWKTGNQKVLYLSISLLKECNSWQGKEKSTSLILTRRYSWY